MNRLPCVAHIVHRTKTMEYHFISTVMLNIFNCKWAKHMDN